MIRNVCNIILTVVLILTASIAVVFLSPQVFGYKTYAVISGSMEPALHVGSLAIVKQTPPEEIISGDIITFTIGGSKSLEVTHRVVDIDNVHETFITKGDANINHDGPVKFDRLTGKTVFSIPYLGFLAVFVKTTEGIVLAAGFLIIMMLITFIPEIFKCKDHHNYQKGDFKKC